MENLKLFEYWLPTKRTGENYRRFVAEMMINTEYEEGKTLLEIFLRPGGKNKSRNLISKHTDRNQVMKLLERIASTGLKERLSISYNLSGGLLNIFNDDVEEKYDEVWKEISSEASAFEREIRWNTTPNNLFCMLTPEEVWACPGQEEFKLLDSFLNELTERFQEKEFEFEGELLTQSVSFLRAWQFTKREDGSIPFNRIKEERKKNLMRNKEILDLK